MCVAALISAPAAGGAGVWGLRGRGAGAPTPESRLGGAARADRARAPPSPSRSTPLGRTSDRARGPRPDPFLANRYSAPCRVRPAYAGGPGSAPARHVLAALKRLGPYAWVSSPETSGAAVKSPEGRGNRRQHIPHRPTGVEGGRARLKPTGEAVGPISLVSRDWIPPYAQWYRCRSRGTVTTGSVSRSEVRRIYPHFPSTPVHPPSPPTSLRHYGAGVRVG